MAWMGPSAAVYAEAVRIVPAVAKHKAEGRLTDVAITYRTFIAGAAEMGVDSSTAWAILTSAYSHWLQNLFTLYAEECGVPVATAVEHAIGAAAEWAGNRG